MKILITGSSGLVGKELKSILKKNNKIIDFNKSDGFDILNKAELELKMKGIDAVIHLAGIIDNNNPSLWEINVKGTKNTIEAAIKNKVKKFIYLSSTGVYGESNDSILETTKTNPQNTYEKSKLEGELITLAKQEQIHVNIIRSAMIFGNNKYWVNFLNLLKKDSPIPTSGTNTFQIISATELAKVIEFILKKGKRGEIYLAAGKEKPTLNEFIEICKKELRINTQLKHIPTIFAIIFGIITNSKTITKNNIRHLAKNRNYDISKLEELGYKQKVTLKESVQKLVKDLF